MDQEDLTNWTARRAGDAITLQGQKDGKPTRITHVEVITCTARGVEARTTDGRVIRLADMVCA